MSAPGRPKGEYRSAQHEGTPVGAQLEVVDAGLAVAVQDRGRFGYRRLGVPVSGALDASLLAAANALVGNAPDAAALEILLTGPALKVRTGRVRFSLAGDIEARVHDAQGRPLRAAPWSTATLDPGDTIRFGAVAAPRAGGLAIACIGISGGVEVPAVLASRSTYARAGLGGVRGRAIAAGDLLPCRSVAGDPWLEFRAPAPWVHAEGPIAWWAARRPTTSPTPPGRPSSASPSRSRATATAWACGSKARR